MLEKKKILVFIVLALITFSSIAQAMTLSTLQKNNFAEINQGETAEFTVLFWNLEDDSLPLSLKPKKLPDGWVVIVKPEEFLLNKSRIGPPYEGNEYIGIPGIGDVEAFPVKVFVKIPETASPGKYETFVTVTAGKSGSGISILQERTFKFTIDVKKAPKSFETAGKTISDTLSSLMVSGGDVVKNLGGMFSSTSFEIQTAILIASIIVVLAVFWVIYRHV